MKCPDGHSRQAILTALPVLWVVIWLAGCSSPFVQHTAVGGNVRMIEHWSIEWAGPEKRQEKDGIILSDIDEESRYTREEYCRKYVADVRRELIEEYGLSFAENFPDRGRIEIKLQGRTPSRYLPPDTAAESRRRREQADNDYPPKYGVSTDAIGGTADVLFTDTDKVVKVELKIIDPFGMEVGQALITHDSIKPSFVAKVIYRLITKGKYDGKSLNINLR